MTLTPRALWRAPFYLSLSLLCTSPLYGSDSKEEMYPGDEGGAGASTAAAGPADEGAGAAAASAALDEAYPLFQRPIPVVVPRDSDLSTSPLILARLREQLTPELLAELVRDYAPYASGSRGALFRKTFHHQYRTEVGPDGERVVLALPLLPEELFTPGNTFTVDDDGMIHVTAPASIEET